MLENSKFLVMNSNIEGAGLGLFTKSLIKKGDMICEYEGEILTYGQYVNRNLSGDDEYFLITKENEIIDAKNTICFAKYANDASINIVELTSDYYDYNDIPSKPNNNSEFRSIGVNRMALFAIKDIQPFEEIYVSYGESYWNNPNRLNKK